ncbi:MAG: hypothetical protein NT004_01980 [Bacteroidetes bacterium]|nr:hypothetical protein [Bacteroidota bacterium]
MLINQGMIQTIKQDIIPRLDHDAPNQPDAEKLKKNKLGRQSDTDLF